MIYLDNNTFQQEIFIPRSSAKNDASPEYATKTELENAIENEVIRADGKYATKTDLIPYATTGWVESQDFATKEWTEEQIQSAITSETARTEETYQKISEMSAYSTTNEVESMIDDAVSGKADSSAVTAQISEVKAEIEAEIPTKVSDLQNDLNFASTGDVESMISGFTTSADVKTQIESYNYINSGQAQTQIDNSISGKLDTSVFNTYSASTQTEIGNKQDASAMTQYATTAFTENTYAKKGDIPTKTSDLTNDSGFITNAALSGYATEQYVDNSVSGKADTSAVTASIAAATAATTGWVENQGYLTAYTETDPVFMASAASGITSNDISNWNDKLDASALTPYYTSAQTDTAISNAVSGKVDTSAMTQYYTSAETETAIQSATENFVTSGEVETQITSKGYITGYTETDPIFQASAASGITSQDITNWDAKLDASALTPYYTSAETNTAISNAVSGLASEEYVDNAVSGKVDTSALTETNNHIDNMEEMTATALLELKNTKADATALTEYAKAEHVAELEQVTSAALNDLNSNKADVDAFTAYTPTSGFATINGSAITEGGSIVIQGGGSEYSAGTNISIDDYVISVTGITEMVEDAEDHIDNMEEMTAIALMDLKTNKADATALTEYAKSEHVGEVEQVTSVALNDLNSNKVGSTDVHHMSVVTQAQYDAMAQGGTLDSSTFYIIL